MKNWILFPLLVLFVIQVQSTDTKDAQSLIDEVKKQLEELNGIVLGAISVAHSDLNDIETDFFTHSHSVITDGTVAIQQQKSSIDTQLNEIKSLANSAHVDISSCLNTPEEILNRIPDEYIDLLEQCVFDLNQEQANLVSDTKYIIDVVINKIHALEFQVQQCGENLQCIAPLIQEIALDKVRLPQNIKTEVNSVSSLVDTLKISVQQCYSTNVAGYTSDSVTLLDDIIDCVDGILG